MALPFRLRVARSVALACLALAGATIGAQTDAPWLVRVWTADGLSNRNLTGVAQTEDRFLWISHGRGIARFDGARFEEFRLSDLAPVRNDGVRALLASRQGGLWAVTNHGEVLRISAKGVTLAIDELPDAFADSVAEDAEGALWLSFPNGALFRVKDGAVTRPAQEAGLTETRTYFATDPGGRLWAVQNNEIGVFDGGRFDKQRQRILPSSRIAPAAAGGVWVADSRALFHCSEGGELKRHAGPNDGARFGGNPSVILEDRSGAVWFGTRPDGLYRYTPADGLRRIATSSPDITSLLEDHEGNIWVATLGGGLNRVSPRAISVEGNATGFPNESIRSLCEDREGRLWAATQNGALMARAGADWKTDANWPTRVTCVVADPQGGVWIGTRQRMLHHLRDGRLETWTQAQGLAGNTAVAMLVDRAGTLWLGQDGNTGVQMFRHGELRAIELPPQTRRLQAMTEDHAGRIWLGFEQGMLVRIEDDKAVNATPADAPPLAIRGLHATPDGALWIGYEGAGIGRWKEGQFALLRAEQGLASDHVVHLIADERGWLWCGGDEGLFKIRLRALADLAEGRETRIKSVRFGLEAGVPERLVATRSWGGPLRTRDGRVWMPMGTALLTIDPSRGSDNREPPPVLVTQVRADGRLAAYYSNPLPAKTIAPGGRMLPPRAVLELEPVRQKIEFAFTAPSFTAPENIHFRCQLVGVDDGWIEAGPTRTVSYARVPAGSYRFRVQANQSDGVWSEASPPLALNVAPFYWQTWWFRLAAIGLFTGATAAIVRSVSHRRLRRRLQVMQQRMTVERERARIARDLHDDAGNRLTRIMLLARLAMRHREQPEKTAAHLEQLSAAAREVTDALDEIVWAVNPRHDTLPDFIAYLGHCAVELLQAAGIACLVEAPEHPPAHTLGADARHNLFLAVKEALNNVVRHSGATEARLIVTSDDRALVVTVVDNGRGLGAAPADPGADGLRNMRVRLEQIGGRLEIHSTSGAGARLSFTYPWPATK